MRSAVYLTHFKTKKPKRVEYVETKFIKISNSTLSFILVKIK